jgi:hypothetical protein
MLSLKNLFPRQKDVLECIQNKYLEDRVEILERRIIILVTWIENNYPEAFNNGLMEQISNDVYRTLPPETET